MYTLQPKRNVEFGQRGEQIRDISNCWRAKRDDVITRQSIETDSGSLRNHHPITDSASSLCRKGTFVMCFEQPPHQKCPSPPLAIVLHACIISW